MTDPNPELEQQWAVLAQGQPNYLRELHQALSDAGLSASILDPQALGSPNR